MDTTHPLPALRMFYAEETANEVLCHYFQKADDLTEVEHEWQKTVCDIEPECNEKTDMGQYLSLLYMRRKHNGVYW